MDWKLLLTLLLVHYIADFFVQTDKQAKNKSISNFALTKHVFNYTLCFIPVILIFNYKDFSNLVLSLNLIFVTHYLTDWVTSRLSKFFFENKNYRAGFQVVGLDQILHYLSLYLIFK